MNDYLTKVNNLIYLKTKKMHQENNFNILQIHIKNRLFSNRYVSFKLEHEQIKKIQILNLTSYICITENNKYKITMHDFDFLDCAIEKI